MNSLVMEEQVGDIRWLVAVGEARDAFRSLGQHCAREIQTVIDHLPETAWLRDRVATEEGQARLRAVGRASRAQHPAGWLELAAMAEGAGVHLDDLLLLTLRGDLFADDAHGCSEFGWTDGRRALFGHNEDGDPSLDGRCFLLTLRLEGAPAITTWWYPGFLPGNTFTVSERGLVWGIDAIRVVNPPVGPGRCFLARGLQRATTLEEAVAYLDSQPAAGGFSYFMGKTHDPRIMVVEHAGRAVAHDQARPPKRGCIWHTNHLCHLPSAMNDVSPDSIRRADILARVSAPTSPDAAWVLGVLAGAPYPTGVRATGEPGSALTLCTLAVDLDAGQAILRPHGGRTVRLSTVDLARGDTTRVEVDHHLTAEVR